MSAKAYRRSSNGWFYRIGIDGYTKVNNKGWKLNTLSRIIKSLNDTNVRVRVRFLFRFPGSLCPSTYVPPLGPQHRVPKPVLSLETHQKVSKWGQIRRPQSRNTNGIQWQGKKSEWKNTEIWEANERAMNTNTGESPGHQSQSQKPRNSPSEEVRGHWTLTGAEPMDQ